MFEEENPFSGRFKVESFLLSKFSLLTIKS